MASYKEKRLHMFSLTHDLIEVLEVTSPRTLPYTPLFLEENYKIAKEE